MSINSIIHNKGIDIVRNTNRIVMGPFGSIREMLNDALSVIGDSLDLNLGAIYQADKPKGFDFICGYKLQDPAYGDCLIRLKRQDAENSLQSQQIIYSSIEGSSLLCFIPFFTDKSSYILVCSIDNELDSFGIELFKSLGDVFAAAINKFQLQQQLNQQYLSTIQSLVVAIEAKDLYTQGHSQRVAEYSKVIGMRMNMGSEELRELEITGLVHDIGKIGVKDQVLTKPERLTESEFTSIKQHPEIGIKILEPLNVSKNVMMGTLLHHKRYDLNGYPLSFHIDKLPLVPSIIGVADAYDAMTSERSYKKSIGKEDAMQELRKNRGTQFHPEVVDVMEELIRKEII